MSNITVNTKLIKTTAPESEARMFADAISQITQKQEDVVPTLVKTLRACGYKAAAV